MQTIRHRTNLYIPALKVTLPLEIEFGYIPEEPSTGFEEYWGIEGIFDVKGYNVDVSLVWATVEASKMALVEEFLKSQRG